MNIPASNCLLAPWLRARPGGTRDVRLRKHELVDKYVERRGGDAEIGAR